VHQLLAYLSLSFADGCSDQCTVESSYTCTGGDASKADTCALPTAAPAGKEFVRATVRLSGVTKEAFSKDSKKRQAFTNGVAEVLSVASAQVLIEDVSRRRSSGLGMAERRQEEVCRLYMC
jgi:hypothetical protein